MMRRRKKSWLTRISKRLTAGKLILGEGKQPRRSQRLDWYSSTIFPKPPSFLLKWRRWITQRWGWVAVLWFLTLALYIAFGTSWFYVYEIETEGLERLSKEEIYHLSHLEGWSVFWLNPQAVAKLLEDAEPWIDHATISLLPPNRVRVQIQERKPLAIWETSTQRLFVDQDGVLFGLRGNISSTMIVIRDRREQLITPTHTVDSTAVLTAQKLALEFPHQNIFDWDPSGGISFLTDEGWRVVFGDYTKLPTKLAAFHTFKANFEFKDTVSLIDLSVPEHPYYRIRP